MVLSGSVRFKGGFSTADKCLRSAWLLVLDIAQSLVNKLYPTYDLFEEKLVPCVEYKGYDLCIQERR